MCSPTNTSRNCQKALHDTQIRWRFFVCGFHPSCWTRTTVLYFFCDYLCHQRNVVALTCRKETGISLFCLALKAKDVQVPGHPKATESPATSNLLPEKTTRLRGSLHVILSDHSSRWRTKSEGRRSQMVQRQAAFQSMADQNDVSHSLPGKRSLGRMLWDGPEGRAQGKGVMKWISLRYIYLWLKTHCLQIVLPKWFCVQTPTLPQWTSKKPL